MIEILEGFLVLFGYIIPLFVLVWLLRAISDTIFYRKAEGFTLAELMIVTAIIGLIVAIAIPNFANARRNAATNACKANLRQLQGAVITYSVEKGSNPTALSDLQPDYMKTVPNCPGNASRAYTYDAGTGDVTCDEDTNHKL